MEKAIETDWRCQSTTWIFLQKVVIANKKIERREQQRETGKRKIIFAIEHLMCAQPHTSKQPQHQYTNTQTNTFAQESHYKNICG